MPSAAAITPIWLIARIGEDRLRVLLRDADEHAIEGGHKAERRQRLAPTRERYAERQEADEPDHAGLHARAAEDGRGRNRRRGVGQRHPAVERNEAHLRAEAGDEERERGVAPGGARQGGDHVGNPEASVGLAGREHAEREEKEGLAEDGEGHVDAPGARGLRRRIEGEHAIGRDADQRVDQVERDEVVGDEHAEAADQGKEPGNRYARLGAFGPVEEGAGADRDPQKRRDREQQRGRQVEAQAELQRRRFEVEGSARKGGDGGEERRDRRQPLQRKRGVAQALNKAGDEESRRDGEAHREKEGAENGHGGPAVMSAGRPMSRSWKNDSGAKPSATAMTASVSATASPARRGGALSTTGLDRQRGGEDAVDIARREQAADRAARAPTPTGRTRRRRAT